MREATSPCAANPKQKSYFNPRFPCGKRHQDTLLLPASEGISIHASHAGSDPKTWELRYYTGNFNPRFPCGKRLLLEAFHSNDILISIHASHAGSDTVRHAIITGETDFNPRFPCGKRPKPPKSIVYSIAFQSTLPMREATAKEAEFVYRNAFSPVQNAQIILLLLYSITKTQYFKPFFWCEPPVGFLFAYSSHLIRQLKRRYKVFTIIFVSLSSLTVLKPILLYKLTARFFFFALSITCLTPFSLSLCSRARSKRVPVPCPRYCS